MALELKFTIPGQIERKIPLDQSAMKIGALLSNQVVLRAPGVDPIHALIEEVDGEWLLTDLGSTSGIQKNGTPIDVESTLQAGDNFTIGGVTIYVEEDVPLAAPPPLPAGTVPPPPPPEAKDAPTRTVKAEERPLPDRRKDSPAEPRERRDVLFSPRKARPGGDVLEVVAYWGDTVLETELFHPTYKGFEQVTIGDPTKAHLIAAGKDNLSKEVFADVKESGYNIVMREGMKGRLRKAGHVEKVSGAGKHAMGRRDIAHIKYGAVSYFMMFVRPPVLNLPKAGPEDPLMLSIYGVMMILYLALTSVAVVHKPLDSEEDKDDIWSIVQVPEKDKPPPVIKQEKKKEEVKPPIKVAEVKKPPPKAPPPKPEPKPVKPAKPVVKEKPKQQKPVEKPAEVPKPTTSLAQNKTNKQTGQKETPKGPTAPRSSLNKLKDAGNGMPSTGAKNPNFKLAGPKVANKRLGAAGGPKGGGMNQKGGAIKGKGAASVMGVEGPKNNKASGMNLSKLGLGVGKILNKSGPGAIPSNFKSSAGGAGGGMGSASKTYGLGGVGSGKSLGLAGGGGANNFGSGSGGFLSGQGGNGGYGGSGLGKAFGGGGAGGKGRADVTLPPGDPVVSGGLTAQEISAVIRANLNQIRHCYEQTLQRSPNASGKMAVMFVVGANGRVTSVRVTESSIPDTKMRGCVTGKIQRWPFPKPRGGQPVTVNYPFVFNPL